MRMQITGLRDVVETLRRAPEAMQQRVLRGAVGAAAALIRDEAVVRAPQYSGRVASQHPPPGTLKRAIYSYRVRLTDTPETVQFRVTVRRGRRAPGGADAYYATFVEYGTVKMAPRPFMRPAFEVRKEEAVRLMRDYIAVRLPAVLGKA